MLLHPNNACRPTDLPEELQPPARLWAQTISVALGPFFRPQPKVISRTLFVSNHYRRRVCSSFHPFNLIGCWLPMPARLLRAQRKRAIQIRSASAPNFNGARKAFALNCASNRRLFCQARRRSGCGGFGLCRLKSVLCDRRRGHEEGTHDPETCGKKPKAL